MKHGLILLTSLFLLSSSVWSAGTLKIITPNGGQKWTAGKTYQIKWSKGNAGAKVKIQLLKNGKAYKWISKSTKNDGKHPWKVPSTVKTGSAYKIRIRSVTNRKIRDDSNRTFQIKTAKRSCRARPVDSKTPPFGGTIFIDPDIIKTTDPSTYRGATYKGRGVRTMFDRRNGGDWIQNKAYLFSATFKKGKAKRIVEVQVNSEFSSVGASNVQVSKYMKALGRIPYMLLKDADTVWIHKGVEPFGGGNRNYLIHTGYGENYIRDGILEETFVHEGTHTSLDSYHYTSTWGCAQKSDVTFISNYARDYPDREDHSESFLMWMALKYRSERLSEDVKTKIKKAIPNRLQYYDDQSFNVYPVR